MASTPDVVVQSSKELTSLLERIQTNLTKAEDKNDALLEAIETAEARALDISSSETTLLRNLRARLAASHSPNALLKQELSVFAEEFQKRFKSLDITLKQYQDLNVKLQQENKDLEEQQNQLINEQRIFEEEREDWKRHLEQAKIEITEQNDRLALLSQQLTGTKQDLEARSNELASRRIAFEEEKLLRESEGVEAVNGEAESLRRRLRDQALKNVQLESTLLRTEVTLHQKEEELIRLERENNHLLHEVEQLRSQSSKAVKLFEKRTVEANKHLAHMSSELSKAQDNSKRFQELLTVERRKQKALQHTLEEKVNHGSLHKPEGLTPTAQKAYIETLSETLQNVGKKPLSALRIQDLVRKNEVVLVENARLKAEIHKLRIENVDLMRRAKFADCNAHHMRNQVLTNLHDRAELMKKLDKSEQQYKELQMSLTKQASDWVSKLKSDKEKEKEHQLNEIQTLSPLAASERTWIKGPAKSSTLSRSIQVHKW